MRLLLAEDDTMIGEAVRAGLRRQGFAVDWVQDGVAAEQALLAEAYDACLLDLGLPRKAGLDVLRRLRERGSIAAGAGADGTGTRSPIASTASTPAPTTTSSSRSTWPNSPQGSGP